MLGGNAANKIMSLFLAIGMVYFMLKDNEVEMRETQDVEGGTENAIVTHDIIAQTNERREPVHHESLADFDVVERDETDNRERSIRVDVQRLRIEEALQRVGTNGVDVPPPSLYEHEAHPIERFDVVGDEEVARIREEEITNNRVVEVNATPFVPPPPLYVPDNQAIGLVVGCGSDLHAI